MFSIFLFCVQFISSIYMLGASWFLQVNHLKLINKATKDSNPIENPLKSATLLVPMIFEAVSILLLLVAPFPSYFSVLILLIFTVIIWAVTIILQNMHKSVCQNLQRFTWTQWLKTLLWSFKAIYLFIVLWVVLQGVIINIS